MITPAIQQAIRLHKHPEELSWLCLPDSDLPEDVNELLRLCASQEKLIEFANTNNINSELLETSLFNFIEKIMLNEKNSEEKILGVDKFSTSQIQKFHYQLLMRIYHPDSSTRLNAEQYCALITNAYQQLKTKANDLDVISFSEYRKPTNKHYQASKKSEAHISNTKTAIAVISTITIFSLVSMAGRFYGSSNAELIASNEPNTNIDSINVVQESNSVSQQLVQVTAVKPNTIVETNKNPIKASSKSLQLLLKNLEMAYEEGDIDTIIPILANAPDIKDQTEKQLHDKLATIFEITSERKMVLFDFKWTNVSGELEGRGKFLSRYQLVGESTWLTREGNASVSAQAIKNKLKITQLILENQIID